MRGNPKAVPFHGILAVGNTKDEAVNRYRLLALGKGVSAMVDQGQSLAFVTHASNKIAEMFNPTTGELDLQKDDSLIQNLDFEAQAGEVSVNHYVCESGCGLHMAYDSDSLVKFCPACTTAVVATASDDEEDADDEEVEDEEDSDDDLDDELDDDEEEDEESESSDDDEEESDEEDDSDDEEADDEESDEEDDSEEDDEEESDDDEESDDEEESDDSEPLVIAADSKDAAIAIYQQQRQGIATAGDTTVDVEYMVCSSSECNAHVLSEDPTITDCPACTSPLVQPVETPAAVASDDEESEDEEDSDLNVIPEDEESEDDEEESDDEDTSESNDASTQTMTDPNVNVETVTVDMLTQINDGRENPHEGLDLSFSSSVAGQPLWTAYYDGVPVATASKADAGQNADIFNDASFGNAVIAGAKHVGVKDTLAQMGFKGINHQIAVSSVVADKVNTQVAEAKDALERDRKEYSERLISALATAAIGINRGFFADVKNPVKEALWNAMASAGVKNPEHLIHNAFRASSDAYHTALFAKASEIIDQPLEVQESLSKAVLGANYMGTSESSTNANSLEDRLENFGTNTAQASAQPEQKPAQKVEQQSQESVSSDARISNVVASLGRRRG